MATPYTKLATVLNAAMAAGKVLDVSNLTADGKGTRTIPVPKSQKGTKKWVGNLPVVSNNYNSYALAMSILASVNPEYNQYAQEYARLHGTGVFARTPKAQIAAGTGPTIPFPMTQNTPPLVMATQLTIKTPSRAKTPKQPKQLARSPIIHIGTPVPRAASPPRATQGMRLPSPPRATQPGMRLPSPPRATQPGMRLPSPPRVTQPVMRFPSPPRATQPVMRFPSPPRVTQPVMRFPSPPRVTQPVMRFPSPPRATQPVMRFPNT
jgi:hypothetical protein